MATCKRGPNTPPGALAWLSEVSRPPRTIIQLPGGAGARSYWRVQYRDGSSAILMHAVPERAEILPPALRRAVDGIPFLLVTHFLAGAGLPVPAIFATDPERRFVLLEDLGERHLCDLEGAELAARQAEAIDLLARIHQLSAADGDGDVAPLPFRRRFDFEWITFELRLFVEQAPESLSRAVLADACTQLAREIAELPAVLCMRDYQSQNLMIDPAGQIRLLDYQDALLAPAALDLAALLFDSYVEIPADTRQALLDRYEKQSGTLVEPGQLALCTIQRKCKDFSRFRSLTRSFEDARYAGCAGRARAAVLATLPDLPRELADSGQVLKQAIEAISE